MSNAFLPYDELRIMSDEDLLHVADRSDPEVRALAERLADVIALNNRIVAVVQDTHADLDELEKLLEMNT